MLRNYKSTTLSESGLSSQRKGTPADDSLKLQSVIQLLLTLFYPVVHTVNCPSCSDLNAEAMLQMQTFFSCCCSGQLITWLKWISLKLCCDIFLLFKDLESLIKRKTRPFFALGSKRLGSSWQHSLSQKHFPESVKVQLFYNKYVFPGRNRPTQKEGHGTLRRCKTEAPGLAQNIS